DLLYRRGQELLYEYWRAFDERRFGHDLVESGLVRGPQTGRVRVVREADDRDLGVGVGDLVWLDPRDVADHELGVVDRIRGYEVVPGQERLELAAKEKVAPRQQDRRHARRVTRFPAKIPLVSGEKLDRGLELMRSGAFFEAHEE